MRMLPEDTSYILSKFHQERISGFGLVEIVRIKQIINHLIFQIKSDRSTEQIFEYHKSEKRQKTYLRLKYKKI